MSNITHQYRIIVDAAGRVDRSGRGRVRLRGSDALSFLQALLTNDVAALEQGDGAYAAYLTPQGRMIADLRLYHRGDHLLADVAAGTGERLAARLDQLIFAEDVQVSDASDDYAQVSVIGGRAPELLAGAFGLDHDALASLPLWHQLDLPGRDGAFVVRTDDAVLPAFDVFVPAAARADIGEALEAAGAGAMTAELVEALRVDAVRPAFGIDMTEQTLPLEAGLLRRAISTDKGCYVGQEIIIRVLHRGGGRVAKRLAKLVSDESVADAPAAGAAIADGDREVGAVTSVARALDDSGWIALGYVRREAAEVGRRVAIGGGGENATIAGFAGDA